MPATTETRSESKSEQEEEREKKRWRKRKSEEKKRWTVHPVDAFSFHHYFDRVSLVSSVIINSGPSSVCLWSDLYSCMHACIHTRRERVFCERHELLQMESSARCMSEREAEKSRASEGRWISEGAAFNSEEAWKKAWSLRLSLSLSLSPSVSVNPSRASAAVASERREEETNKEEKEGHQ